jgi:hypothetical protein
LDSPCTNAEIAEAEALEADLKSPLIVDESELTDRERAFIAALEARDASQIQQS